MVKYELTLNELIGKLSAIRNQNQDVPPGDLRVSIGGSDYLYIVCKSQPVNGITKVAFQTIED